MTIKEKEAGKKVTKKKRAFIEAYISDVRRNQTAAAIKAGYSEKGAAQAASRLMKDAEVAAEIDARIKELHRERTAQADEIIEFLTSVMRGEEVETVTAYCGGELTFTDGKPTARDKLKAAELLGKYYAIFTDTARLDTGDCGVILMPEVTDDG